MLTKYAKNESEDLLKSLIYKPIFGRSGISHRFRQTLATL